MEKIELTEEERHELGTKWMIEVARSQKEGWIRDAADPRDGQTTANTNQIQFWRDGNPVCFTVSPSDKYHMLSVAQILVPAMGIERAIVGFDGFMCRWKGKNADEMTPDDIDEASNFWDIHSMQDMWEQGRAEEFGITEVLTVSIFTRNADEVGCTSEMYSMPYVVDYDNRKVNWTNELDDVLQAGVSYAGFIPETFDKIFSRKMFKLDQMRQNIADAMNIPLDEVPEIEVPPYARLHSDMGALRFMKEALREAGYITPMVGYYVDAGDEVALEKAQRSLQDMGFEDALVEMMDEYRAEHPDEFPQKEK